MVKLHPKQALAGILVKEKPLTGILAKEKTLNGVIGVGVRPIESDAVVQVQTKFELPTVGDPQLVYFVIGENAVYRWDAEKLLYFCSGRDYEEIDLINGGTANE